MSITGRARPASAHRGGALGSYGGHSGAEEEGERPQHCPRQLAGEERGVTTVAEIRQIETDLSPQHTDIGPPCGGGAE
jgi:hypothetical protein